MIIGNLLEIRGSSQSVEFLVEKRATSWKVILIYNFVYPTCRTPPRSPRLVLPFSADDRSLPMKVPVIILALVWERGWEQTVIGHL